MQPNDYQNIDLKVLNSQNKRDYRLYTLRHLSRSEDSPEKLKDEISKRCGDAVSDQGRMEIGYFNHTKKLWLINNQLDMDDMWDIVSNGSKVTLWCVGTVESTSAVEKRSLDSSNHSNPVAVDTMNHQ